MFSGTPTRKPAIPTRRAVPTWVLWVMLVIVVIAVLLVAGYTVFSDYTGFGTKKAWDWLELVGISTAIGLVGWIVTRKQRERDEAVALERAQDEMLRAYLDQMSNLMVDQKLGKTREDDMEDSVRRVAQARTTAVLLGLDGRHKRRPLKLVYELELINEDKSVLKLENAGLDHADLSELSLRKADLRGADLRASDLSGADLSGSNLGKVDLRGSDLRRADLSGTDLTDANLLPYDERDPERWSAHNLTKIDLKNETLCPRRLTPKPVRKLTTTNLSEAVLVGACLHSAYLGGADLRGADLSNADLSGARGVTKEELERQARFLKGATMPDGSKHE